MTSHLDVHLSTEPGALQRFLGVIRRRGFAVTSINAVRHEAGNSFRIDLVVEGARCPSTLHKHLDNLVDVRAVHMLTRLPQAVCA